MVKPSKVAREFSKKEVEDILSVLIPSRDGKWTLRSFEYVFGGLSTTTIKVSLIFSNAGNVADFVAILKIFYPNPAPISVFQSAIRIMGVLSDPQYDLPVPKILFSDEIQTVKLKCGLSVPCLLLEYIGDSVAADVAVETLGADRKRIMEFIGEALAKIHSVSSMDGLPSYRDGGAVELYQHINGSLLSAVRAKNDSNFTEMYERELKNFAVIDQLPVGIIHGDPFLDNFLVNRHDFMLTGVVDFEDACIGPLLFDLGSAIAGSCFVHSDRAGYELDLHSVEVLLRGYERIRPLSQLESTNLTRLVKVALLCNCTFRFLMHSENTYQNLLDKIAFMNQGDVVRTGLRR
jgi:Ser/Thr protein kinase RdoA (MazF antagonist)